MRERERFIPPPTRSLHPINFKGRSERPMSTLRVLNGRLQQEWEISNYEASGAGYSWWEWRDVPVIDEPGEEE